MHEDSNLITSFMQKKFLPKKKNLVLEVKRAKEVDHQLCRAGITVNYIHMPREKNNGLIIS